MRTPTTRRGAARAASPTSGPRRSAAAGRPDAPPRDPRGRHRRRLRWHGRRTAAGSGVGRAGRASHARSASVRRNSSTALSTVGQDVPAFHQLPRSAAPAGCPRPACRAPSRAPSRAAGRAPADRESAAAHRRADGPMGGRRGEWTMLGGTAISTSASSISRGAVVAGHRQHRPRHPGQPRGRRDEQRGARRRRALGEQLPPAGGDQVSPRMSASSVFGGVVRERACGDGAFDRPPAGSPLFADRAARRSAIANGRERGIVDHPGDRRVRLSDHPQAGIGGDADIGEAQDQSGAAVTATSTRPPRRR